MYQLQKVFTRVILEGIRQITILQSLPIFSQVLILILGIIIIPSILALSFSILLTLVFAIPGVILCIRWIAIFLTEDDEIGAGDIKVPTFYASYSAQEPEPGLGEAITRVFCMPVVGVVFGGIHCVGWSFHFPSSAEAMLWRVSSAVLTGIAFLFPTFFVFMGEPNSHRGRYFLIAFYSIIILVYVVSRLLLLVEAFISLRHLTSGMLALVEWTSFIPHI